jgi:hypothetical protein
MKALTRSVLAAAAAFAMAAPLTAQAVTLDFEDLNPAGGFFGATNYRGFSFANLTGTPGTGLGPGGVGEWYWAAGSAPYYSAGNVNIGATSANPGSYDAMVITSASGSTFSFQGAMFSGCCGAIGIEMTLANGSTVYLGSGFAGGPGGLGSGGATNGGTFDLTLQGTLQPGGGNIFNFVTDPAYANVQIRELVIWGEASLYAMDNIMVTPVPEPSTLALSALGLGALGFMARRRRQEANKQA